MYIVRKLSVIAAVGLLGMSSLAAVGCGGAGSSEAKVADVKAGDMPQGATWTGVYYSELFGYLHLVEEGSSVTGKWMRPVKDRWGELHGEVTGDVLHFSYTEHKIGAIGPSAKRTGKGYFKYGRPQGDNVDDTIVGEIGAGEDEVGTGWDAIKQRNVTPDLASIGGGGSAEIQGGDWDSDNQDTGAPEAPAQP